MHKSIDQTKLVEAARKQLKNFGIAVICLDRLNEKHASFQKAVDALVLDTLYWEGVY